MTRPDTALLLIATPAASAKRAEPAPAGRRPRVGGCVAVEGRFKPFLKTILGGLAGCRRYLFVPPPSPSSTPSIVAYDE